MPTLLANRRNRIVDLRADELREMWFGFLFNFIVLSSYCVIRPIRDDIGAAVCGEAAAKSAWLTDG